jgi:hypothetical protein
MRSLAKAMAAQNPACKLVRVHFFHEKSDFRR